MKAFEDLGVLMKLGLGGVAQLAAEVRIFKVVAVQA